MTWWGGANPRQLGQYLVVSWITKGAVYYQTIFSGTIKHAQNPISLVHFKARLQKSIQLPASADDMPITTITVRSSRGLRQNSWTALCSTSPDPIYIRKKSQDLFKERPVGADRSVWAQFRISNKRIVGPTMYSVSEALSEISAQKSWRPRF